MTRDDWTHGTHRIELLGCPACHWMGHLPRERCPRCHAWPLVTTAAPGRGGCLAVTRIPARYSPAGADVGLALVNLGGTTVMMQAGEGVHSGSAVVTTFRATGTEGRLVPVAVLADEADVERP